MRLRMDLDGCYVSVDCGMDLSLDVIYELLNVHLHCDTDSTDNHKQTNRILTVLHDLGKVLRRHI
jgi:hypothetical protein